MKRIRKTRQSVRISESLRRKLDMYSLAATAGLSIAALASPAEGEVIFTPAHQEVGRNGLTLDLNHDGIGDFKILPTVLRSDSDGILVYSQGMNRVFGATTRNFFASNLPAGYRVGPNSMKFKTGGTFFGFGTGPARLMYICERSSGGSSCSGPWAKTTANGYIGFQFLIDGETHYGWARIRLEVKQPFFQIHAYLTGYAYETIVNKPIMTGQTSGTDEQNAGRSETQNSSATLGMLSAGTPALPLWRPSLH